MSTDRGIMPYQSEDDDAVKAASSSGQSPSSENSSSTVTSMAYFEYRSMFIGPLPLPEMLEHYERVLPGCAERILAMSERGLALTEEQMRHRQGIEAAVVQGDIKRADLGLKFGTIVMTFIIVCWRNRPFQRTLWIRDKSHRRLRFSRTQDLYSWHKHAQTSITAGGRASAAESAQSAR